MATLNFPTSPSLNDTYSFNGKTWVWNGLGWQLQSQGAINGIIIGNSTPAAGTFTALSATGNITGGNLNASGLSLSGNVVSAINSTSNITTTANVSSDYFLGNGAFLTGVITSVANINNGNSNVSIDAPGANVTVSVDGISNVAVFADTGEYITGVLSASGNITGANLNAAGLSLSSNVVSALNSTSAITTTANITGGNLNAAGLSLSSNVVSNLNVTSNIAGGNINTVGNVFTPTIQQSGTYNPRINLGAGTGIVDVGGNGVNTQFLPSGQVRVPSVIYGGTFDGGQLDVVDTGGGVLLSGLRSDTVKIQTGTAGTAANTWVFSGNQLSAPGNVLTTSNILGSNVVATSSVSAVSVVASGNVTGNNVNVTHDVRANNAIFNTAAYANAQIVDRTQLATKFYVDNSVAAGINIHSPVVATTTGNLTATYTPGGTTPTWTDIVDNKTLVTASAHGLNINDQITFFVTTNGVVANLAYFVYDTPNATSITLSEIWVGPQITNLTNGTGLSITSRAKPGVGATLTNTGAQAALTLDGIALSVNDRVLVKDQTTTAQNGIYVVTDVGSGSSDWILTRSSDTNQFAPQSPTGLSAGDYVYVDGGLTEDGTSYVQTTNAYIIIGTTGLTYTQFSGTVIYTGTSPITITGQTIALANTTGTGNTVVLSTSPSLVTPNLGAATGTSVSVTGNVTGGNILAGSGAVSTTGNVVGGNVLYGAGQVSGTGNILANNIAATNQISATGNLISNLGLYVGAGATSTSLTNPIIVAQASGLAFVQVSAKNIANTGSADFVAYADNSTEDAVFADMGMTGSGFNDTAYTITGANDGYVFVQGNTDGTGGRLVLATGEYGDNPDIVFATGGFLTTDEKMRFIHATGQFDIETTTAAANTTTGALRVRGGAGVAGNIYAGGLVSVTGNILTTANISGGNVLTGGEISATGNVVAGNIMGGANVNATTHTGTTVSVTGNVTGGNIVTSGAISTTANVVGGNIVTGGVVTTANINGATTLTITTGAGDINIWPTAGNVHLANTYINHVATPVQSGDAVNKQYVDDAVSAGIHIHEPVYVEAIAVLAATYTQGGTTHTVTDITGNTTLTFSSAHSLNVNDQIYWGSTFNGITANTSYFVYSVPANTQITLTGTLSGPQITTLTNGTGLSQVGRANPGVGASLTANTNGAVVIDGVTLTTTRRVLVYKQPAGAQNGVYTVTDTGNISAPWVLTRATDADLYNPQSVNGVGAGDYFYIEAGTHAGQSYVLTEPTGEIILGYDSLTYTQFAASVPYIAGNGLSLNGTTFSVNVDNDTTAIVGGNVVVKTSANLITPNIGAATGSSLSVTGNISTSSEITAVGNVTGNYFLGNGALLTGITAVSSYGDSNVAAYLPTYTGNLVSLTGPVTTTANITGGNINTGGIISATGNITSIANISGGNVLSSALIQGVTLSASGNIDGGNIATAGTVTATGNITTTANISGGNITAANSILGTTLSVTGNVTGGNLNATGLSLSGNITGGNLSVINTVVAPQLVTNNIRSDDSSFITIEDGLIVEQGLIVTGNVTGDNLNAAGLSLSGNVVSSLLSTANITTTANIAGGNLIQNGVRAYKWTTSESAPANPVPGDEWFIPSTGKLYEYIDDGTSSQWVDQSQSSSFASLAVSGNATITGNLSAGNINGGANVFATTHTGTTVSVTGNIDGGNTNSLGLHALGNGSKVRVSWFNDENAGYFYQGNTYGVNVSQNAYANASGTTIATNASGAIVNVTDSTLTYGVFAGATPGATVVANTVFTVTASGNATATGNISGGNLVTAGAVSTTGNVAAGNVIITGVLVDNIGNLELQSTAVNGNINLTPAGTGIVGVATALSVTGNTTGGNLLTGGLISATGGITGTSLNIGTGAATVGSITNASANGVGNIGAVGSYFNTVFAKATSAQYADLAETYSADAVYPYGTVVVFGGSHEITVSDISHDTRVAGVISKDPAHLMNSAAAGLPVALTGRVQCQVRGPVRKGDILVNIDTGTAGPLDPALAAWGCVIGKSLEDYSGDGVAMIEIAVGRF